MNKKIKRNVLLMTGLAGSLVASSIAGVALSSCTTTSSTSDSNVQYSYVIDWSDPNITDRLTIDNNGLVYSDSSKTTIIATSPSISLTTITIPSSVKSIAGYAKVVYSDSKGNLYDSIPDGATASDYFKTYKSVGAFQGNVLVKNIILESGSKLQSIGALAFSGCTNLETISGLSNSLTFVGDYAFGECSNLTAIDLSNVINVGIFAFYNCTSLGGVDLSNAITIGRGAFWNCSSLTSLGSLEKAKSIGRIAFLNATASGSNISLKLPNLSALTESCFADMKGVNSIDFSGNTALTSFDSAVFRGSSITTVDFTGCSNLKTIGERAFKDCTNLTAVYLPSNDATSLTTIGSNAFINCTNLTTVNVKGTTTTTPGFVATSKLNSLGSNFLANTAITSVDLSNFAVSSTTSTTQFGSTTPLAFIYNLSSVTLPEGLTTLNAGLFYKSGTSSENGFTLTLPSTITSIQYLATLTVTNGTGATDDSSGAQETITNATPFSSSGVGSVDMSKVTSYQATADNTLAIPSYLFNGATKLTSVVLKAGTTAIGDYAFQGTTALTSITYGATANTPTPTADANGFIASSTLATIGTGAFYNAFSEASAATVDLSAMTFATTPAAFTGSNIATVKLPATVTTITANSFDNMTKLSSFNFEDLTKLTTIAKTNFNNTSLTNINLSKTALSSFIGSGSLFTNLPVGCVVSLPTTINSNFSGVFKDVDGNLVTFNYPNGVGSSLLTVTSGVMTFTNSSSEQLNNVGVLDLSSNENINSIGVNTFFGNTKLSSLSLNAKGISSANIFTSTNTAANATNTTTATGYTKANVPLGNNTAFTSLNYSGFTNTTGTVTNAETLFNTTNTTTWTEVAKIINSLSYQASPTSETEAKALKANMSTWTATTGATSAINTDATTTWANAVAGSGNAAGTPAQITIANAYKSANATNSENIVITATTDTATIVHNGITWTYKNDGTSITLTASNVNMYKATVTSGSNSTSYLTFFNELAWKASDTAATTYYVPATQSVNVTLTIATASSSAS